MHGYDPTSLGLTCLIQLSTPVRCYVIDVLSSPAIWSAVGSVLTPIFGDSNIVKIGHGISYDVRALHRDFGVAIVNAFDTHEAAKSLSLPKTGLAHLCEYYGLSESQEYKRLKEMYQVGDWKLRPLKAEQVLYGAMDVWYLILLRRLMIRDVTR